VPFDPNWSGSTLYDTLKQHTRGRVEPKDMLYRTIQNGLLYHLGLWILQDYFEDDRYIDDEIFDEYRAWYLEDFIEAIKKLFPSAAESANIKKGEALLEKIEDMYDISDESEYCEFLESEEGVEEITDCYRDILNKFDANIPGFLHAYALNYAERVFHDRELCSYISELLVEIGFDGMGSPHDTEPKQWIPRIPFPAWARRTVIARDRGKCAECGKDLSQELLGDEHIDHMVPLRRAGTNDLVNLQLLCSDCNLKKSANLIPARSSIPPYLTKLHKKKP
jgi:hypothetical protein